MRARFPLCLAAVLGVGSLLVLSVAGRPAGPSDEVPARRPVEVHPAHEEISPEAMELLRRAHTLPRGERREGEALRPPTLVNPAR